MSEKPVNYSNYSYGEKGQYYTPEETAQKCFNAFCEVLSQFKEEEKFFNYIEPSVGNGVFLNVLPKDRILIGLDIEPRIEPATVCPKHGIVNRGLPLIVKENFLNWVPANTSLSLQQEAKQEWEETVTPGRSNKTVFATRAYSTPRKQTVVFGNPPFGLRGNLALRFLNHASAFSDFVCFILPSSFESDGKGSTRTRVKNLNLIYSKPLENDTFLDPDGGQILIKGCVFQVWSKHHKNEDYFLDTKRPTSMGRFTVLSLSDGGTSGTTRNRAFLDKCDIYLPSTCYKKEDLKLHADFESLPGRKGYGVIFHSGSASKKEEHTQIARNIDWVKIATRSPNSSYNLRTTLIENQLGLCFISLKY